VDADTSAGFAALGDATRRLIVGHLGSGPLPVGAIAARLPVGRPAASMHLRVLKDAGLVIDRQEGTRRLYQLNPPALAALRDYLDWYWTQALTAYKQAAEQQQEGGEDPVTPELKVAKSVVVECR
jgi:DNA-binding transcriptional ArsR family regulator